MGDFLDGKMKKWITMVSMGLLGIHTLSPTAIQQLNNVAFSTFTWLQIVAVVTGIGIYWIHNGEIAYG